MSARLRTILCDIPLRNPVLAASGTYAYGVELKALADLDSLGGIIVKGLSREPMEGNPPPRLWETAAGMINSVGLQNIGACSFVRDKLPELRSLFGKNAQRSAAAASFAPGEDPAAPGALSTPIFANIFGYSIEDYQEVVRVLEDAEGLAGYELNVSCPNTQHGGIYFSSDPALLAELVRAVRPLARRPLMVKLSPNVARIEPLARAAEEAGGDAVSLVNTFVALAVDPRTRRPRLGAGFGGLSGPAIKPIALRMVWEAAQAVRIPVVGLGGIASGEDAAEFLIAGATAVEVGTASFWDPGAPVRVARELDEFLQQEKIDHVGNLVGTLRFQESHEADHRDR